MWAAPTLGPHPWSRSGDRDVKSALCWASVRDDSCRRYLLDACAVLPGCLVGKIRLSVPPIPVRPPAFPSKTLSLSLLPGVCPDPKLWAKLSLELNKAPISSRADRAIVPAFIVSLRVCSRCSEVSKMEAAGRESWTIRWDLVSTDKRDEKPTDMGIGGRRIGKSPGGKAPRHERRPVTRGSPCLASPHRVGGGMRDAIGSMEPAEKSCGTPRRLLAGERRRARIRRRPCERKSPSPVFNAQGLTSVPRMPRASSARLLRGMRGFYGQGVRQL